MENIQKMIEAARGSRPADFEKHFNAEMFDRIGSALQDTRREVVSKMFTFPGQK